MDQLVLRNNDVICISWKVISLIIIYITGEFLASQATKLTGSRQLRKLSGRKSIGNMGGRGSSMARGSRYGGRGSSMARGSFMVNMGIAEEAEDENNEEIEGMVSSLCSIGGTTLDCLIRSLVDTHKRTTASDFGFDHIRV